MTLLRERMAEDLRIRNYSPRTVECYLSMMARFTREFGKPPGELGPAEIRTYQVRPGFFLPVRVVGATFHGKFVAQLRAAFERGELRFQGSLQPLRDPAAFVACLDRAMAKPWVVYSKPPFGGPAQVLKYLARYTHRVAIGNRRILDVCPAGVTFRWRDRAQGNRSRTMSYRESSSCGASCGTSCRAASLVCVTTDCSPTASGRQSSPRAACNSVGRCRRPRRRA